METILVKGPVLLKVKGECEILGTRFANTLITYKNNKYLPIEKCKDSTITLKKNSHYVFPRRNTVHDQSRTGTRIWNNLIESILKTNRNRIIIIGPADSGKSTLTLFLANKLIREGLSPLVIDSDIGQGELAPPTCIGATTMSIQSIDLSEVNPDYINFIGDIQPIGHETRIIDCIKRSLDKLNKDNNITIVNTDGYIGNSKNNYKIKLIEKTEPDCIICMGEGTQINDLHGAITEKFSNAPNMQILQGQSPIKWIYKSLYDRREKRATRYTRLFKTLVNKVTISRKKLSGIYYKDRFFLMKIISSAEKANASGMNNKFFEGLLSNKSFIRGRFVGLSLKEDHEKIIGFGIIKDLNKDLFSIQSSVSKFDCVFLSDIKLYFYNSQLCYHRT